MFHGAQTRIVASIGRSTYMVLPYYSDLIMLCELSLNFD